MGWRLDGSFEVQLSVWGGGVIFLGCEELEGRAMCQGVRGRVCDKSQEARD